MTDPRYRRVAHPGDREFYAKPFPARREDLYTTALSVAISGGLAGFGVSGLFLGDSAVYLAVCGVATLLGVATSATGLRTVDRRLYSVTWDDRVPAKEGDGGEA